MVRIENSSDDANDVVQRGIKGTFMRYIKASSKIADASIIAIGPINKYIFMALLRVKQVSIPVQ